MKDPRRWLLWVAVAATLGWAAATFRNSSGRAGVNQPCLVLEDCARTLRCYVEPNSDGFATFGVCVEPCIDDLQCPAGNACMMTAEAQSQLVPVKPGLKPGDRVCARAARR